MKTVLKSYWNPVVEAWGKTHLALGWSREVAAFLKAARDSIFYFYHLYTSLPGAVEQNFDMGSELGDLARYFWPLPSGGQKSAKSAKSIEIPWFLSGRGTFAEPSALSEYQKVRKIQTLNRDANGAKKCNTFYCLIAENGALKAKHENPDFWPDFPKKLS